MNKKEEFKQLIKDNKYARIIGWLALLPVFVILLPSLYYEKISDLMPISLLPILILLNLLLAVFTFVNVKKLKNSEEKNNASKGFINIGNSLILVYIWGVIYISSQYMNAF